jgi:hypothetical protein
MQKAARRRPLRLQRGSNYFEAALAADIAAVAADEAASAADEAAIDDVAAAEALSAVGAGVTTAGGVVVVVVVVSSFLVQAAKETAAASVTINSAVLIFLLDWGFVKLAGRSWESSLGEDPIVKDKEGAGAPVPSLRL